MPINLDSNKCSFLSYHLIVFKKNNNKKPVPSPNENLICPRVINFIQNIHRFMPGESYQHISKLYKLKNKFSARFLCLFLPYSIMLKPSSTLPHSFTCIFSILLFHVRIILPIFIPPLSFFLPYICPDILSFFHTVSILCLDVLFSSHLDAFLVFISSSPILSSSAYFPSYFLFYSLKFVHLSSRPPRTLFVLSIWQSPTINTSLQRSPSSFSNLYLLLLLLLFFYYKVLSQSW